MPWADENPNDLNLPVAMGVDAAPAPAAPDLRTVINSAFDLNNPVYNAARSLQQEQYPIEPGYNPLEDERVKGSRYESQYASNFTYAYSPQDTARIIADIDREEQDQRTLEAGGWAGTGASIVAGMLDPTILLPGGAIVRGAKGGYSAVRSMASIGAMAAAQTAIQEGVLYNTQQTRRPEESFFNIGTSTLLAAFLGAGAAKLLSKGERQALERALDETRAKLQPPPAASIPSGPESAGAAAADLRTGELRPFVPAAVSNVYEKAKDAISKVPVVGGAMRTLAELPEKLAVRSNPMLRMLTSESQAARRAVGDLVDIPLETKDNLRGITTSKFGTSLEMEVEVMLKRAESDLYRAADEAFQDYRFNGQRKMMPAARSYLENKFGKSDALTQEQFMEEVDLALRNGDDHEIPAVKELAAKFRAQFNIVKDMANKLGFDIGDTVLGAKSFAPRVIDRVALTEQRPEFIRRYVAFRQQDQLQKANLRDDLNREWDILMRSRAQARKLEGRIGSADRRLGALENRLSERGMEAKATVDRSLKLSDRAREATAAIEEAKQFIQDLKDAGIDTPEIRQQIRDLESGVKQLEANSQPISESDLDAVEKAERDGILVGPMRRVARHLTGKTKTLPKPPSLWKWIAQQGGVKDDGGDLLALGAERPRGLFSKDGLQWDDLQTRMIEDFPELRARWSRDGVAEDFSNEIRQWVRDSTNGNDPEWFLTEKWGADDRFVFEMSKLLDDAAGEAGVEFKSLNDVADFMRGEPSDGLTLADLDRISADLEANGAGLEAYIEADGLQQRIAIRQQTIDLFKQTVAKARDNLAKAKVKGRIAGAVQAEAGVSANRNLGRLGILNKRAADAQAARDLLEQAKAAAKATEEAQLAKIEDIISRWEGNSSRDAKAAMRRRGEYDAQRTAEQKAKQPRLGSADRAIAKAVKRILKNSELKSDQELAAEAEQTIGQYLSTPDGRLPKDEPGVVQQPSFGEDMGDVRGSLNRRKNPMSDNDLRPFLIRNPLDYTMRYLRQGLTDLNMIARFGDTDGTQVMKQIADDYAAAMRQTSDPKKLRQLQDAMDGDVRDFAAMRDRLKGVYGFSPDAFLQSAGRVAESLKSFNMATLSGGFGLNQIADFSGVVYRYGLTSAFKDAWGPLFSRLSRLKEGGLRAMAGEWAALGVGGETFLQSRMIDKMGMENTYFHRTPFERTLRLGANTAATLSGVTILTDFQKVAMASAASNNILRAAKAIASGNASERQIASLAAGGIDAPMAERIWKSFDQGGGAKVDGALEPNLKDWADQDAARRFEAAVLREVKIGVLTPGQEKPLFLSSPVLSLFGQFKSFVAAAHTRILLANLQRRDASALSGLVTHVAFGMLTYAAYTAAKGGTFHDRPQDWIKEGVDRSGVLGWFSEMNAMSSKATGGQADLFRLIGADKPISRYASRGLVGNLLGPTYGLAEDASSMTYAISNGQWTESDTQKLRRLIPFQNLFYLRQLFDQVQANGNALLGIEPRAANDG